MHFAVTFMYLQYMVTNYLNKSTSCEQLLKGSCLCQDLLSHKVRQWPSAVGWQGHLLLRRAGNCSIQLLSHYFVGTLLLHNFFDESAKGRMGYWDTLAERIVAISAANWHIFMPSFRNLAFFGGGCHKYFWFGIFWHIFQRPIFFTLENVEP